MKLAHWPNRYAKRPARPVLRSTQEIAELLGVSQQVFVAMVNNHAGPEAFDPKRADKMRYWGLKAVLAWWEGLPPDIREFNTKGKKRQLTKEGNVC